MSAGGTRQALTEEQRQQIIAKLLSERRSQQAAQASSRQAELPQEERAAKLHQLLSRRAAGKQQLDQQLPWPSQPIQQPQQQQWQGYQQQHQQWQQPQHVHAQQQRQQYKQQSQRHRASSSGDSERGGTQDPLLSPGSTTSVLSSISAVAAGGGASHRQAHHKHLHHQHQRQHHHHHQQQPHHQQQQQQQQPALRPQQPSQRQQAPGSSHPGLKPSTPRGFSALLRQSQQPPQHQQQQRQPADSGTAAPMRQQREAKPSDVGHSVLAKVLDGPVDISDLWASRALLSGLPDSPDDSQGSGCSQEDSQGSAGAYAPSAGHSGSGSTLSDSDDGFDSELAGISFGSDDEVDGSGDWRASDRKQQQRVPELQQLRGQPQGRSHAAARPQQSQGPAAGQQQRQAQQFHQPTPPSHPRQPQQQQLHRRSSEVLPLPASYPDSRAERLQQLAQPKATQRQKYDRMKAEAEQHMLQQCSFAPKTGRGPAHRCAPQGSASDRLYKAAAERKARLEQKAAAHVNSDVQDCTFQPHTNAAANARVLESYEYVPLHKRLGQVMRSRSEKLANIQLQVEEEVSVAATFTPRINPRSSMLASLRRSRSCSRARGGEVPGGGGTGGSQGWAGAAPVSSPRDAAEKDGGDVRDVSRGRSRERGASARSRRTWSEAGQSRGRSQARPEESACTFSPSINARSELLLQASGEIPLSFLQRQEYFDRLAKEKKQLLQLAVEDAHCSFRPAKGSSRGRLSDRGGSLDQEETFLDRIEQLAYADKRRIEASRTALAEHVHATECTFAPAINPRSARMARATPLQELYENSKGRMRRDSVALALELQEQSECTFAPNLRKPGPCGTPPAEARLNLSAEEVAGVVDRLYADPRDKAAHVGGAASYQQYQELKACTFKPEINREVPKQQGPVLVRGLGRFLELKDMARQQAEAKAALEAKVFLTQPKEPQAPFTTPQPFKLGPTVPSGYEGRRRRAVREAEEAVMGECTFQPRINTHHRTRQQRVAELLARH